MAKVLLSVKDLKVYYPVRKGFFKLKKAYVKAVDGVSFDVYLSLIHISEPTRP